MDNQYISSVREGNNIISNEQIISTLPNDIEMINGAQINISNHQEIFVDEKNIIKAINEKKSIMEDEEFKSLYENLNAKKFELNEIHREVNGKISAWNQHEDEKLMAITENIENKDWNEICKNFEDKTAVQCFYRYVKVIKPILSSKTWTNEEDELLQNLIKTYGPTKWTEISRKMKKKSRKECMNRWNFHLSGSKQLRTVWLPSEELKLLLIVKKYGTYWSKIAKLFEDKDEYSTKNKFYSLMRKTANMKKNEERDIVSKNPENKENGGEHENFKSEFKGENQSPLEANGKKSNVFSLKLKELIIYLNDAIQMLKYEQNISNAYEEEINKILDDENSFTSIGERLNSININMYTEINSNENLNAQNSQNLIKNNGPVQEQIKTNTNKNNQILVEQELNYQLINNQGHSTLNNVDQNILKDSKTNEPDVEDVNTFQCFDNPFEVCNNNFTSQNDNDYCIQDKENKKAKLCKKCKSVLKDSLKKKILSTLMERNTGSCGNLFGNGINGLSNLFQTTNNNNTNNNQNFNFNTFNIYTGLPNGNSSQDYDNILNNIKNGFPYIPTFNF